MMTLESVRRTINVAQAREHIGCKSRSYVYRLLEQGKLEGYKYGDRMGTRIYMDSVERFIREKTDQMGE